MPTTAEFVNALKATPKLMFEYASSPDAEEMLNKQNISDLTPRFRKYFLESVAKIRAYTVDQAHVLEVKAAAADVRTAGLIPMANSGNGAPGTGW
ncbi:hypothetical protein [Ciceribacter sp. RN22]|uniref:hypothetical protein n=1 Tax=Ciceribacter sp. RN22 TaxID=2954932 RepID=UPI0020933838|nr:hypothetical protein [Ciceribacter sp. RN22]MCO6178217.1 hypothetical protein [Ciceribacter sp. RN22]